MAHWETKPAPDGSKLSDVIALLEGPSPFGRIFRGVGDSTWPLETTLDRAARRLKLGGEAIVDLERALFREFRRRFHHYQDRVPDNENPLEWLALMQHHGAPTRLLDWTYSPHVALFFALESMGDRDPQSMPDTSRTAGIFVADRQQLRTSAIEKAAARGLDQYLREFNPPQDKWFEHLFLKNRELFVAPVNPYFLNERLTIQRGLFLASGDVKASFEDNVLAMTSDPAVTLVTIPEGLRGPLLRELFEMNISAATLFPGLDGFARSLRGWVPYVDMILSGEFRKSDGGNRDWKDL